MFLQRKYNLFLEIKNLFKSPKTSKLNWHPYWYFRIESTFSNKIQCCFLNKTAVSDVQIHFNFQSRNHIINKLNVMWLAKIQFVLTNEIYCHFRQIIKPWGIFFSRIYKAAKDISYLWKKFSQGLYKFRLLIANDTIYEYFVMMTNWAITKIGDAKSEHPGLSIMRN